MPLSNYPNGFPNGVTIRGVPLAITHPGEVFWVNSTTVLAKGGIGSSNGNKGTYQQPFATIDYAIGQCTASRGDIIAVMPGHTETISAAAGIACDVAGIAIVGLGKGSLRPTITLDTAATASMTISAANVTISNLLFSAAFADITRIINVTSTDAHIDQCEFVAAAADENWVDVIDASGADNTADGLTVTGCRAFDLDAANDSFIEITGDINRLTVVDNLVVHDNASATAMIEQATGKDMVNTLIQNNSYMTLKTAGDVLVDNDTTANSGMAIGNYASHADTAAEVLVDADGLGQMENYGSGVITASGYLLPAADS
jgi:hypothetical protein